MQAEGLHNLVEIRIIFQYTMLANVKTPILLSGLEF